MEVRAVFLVGFMAAGKSSVGKELAQRWQWDFVDLDAHIEAREGHSIPHIFQEKGEDGFRRAETSALRELIASMKRDTVVALGGGAFTQPQNRALLQSWPSVFLEASLEELWQRSLRDEVNRPLRKSREDFANLYQQRLPSYREATATVRTSGKGSVAICSEIERLLQVGAEPQAGQGSAPSPRPQNSGTGELS